MKNYTKHFIITLFIVFLLAFFPISVVNGGTDNEAYKDGYSNGLWEGMDAAHSDLEDLARKNYSKAMPKESEIISIYDLDKETKTYRNNFLRGFKDGFREGYNTTYDNPRIEIYTTNYDEAIGFEMGRVSGYRDYYANKKNKWASAVPSTTKIIELFELAKEPNIYRNNFIVNFKRKFHEGYEYAYRYAKLDSKRNDIIQGAEDGETMGGLLGENYGVKDFTEGRVSDWERNLPSDKEIEGMFSLGKDDKGYGDSFIPSFKNSFKERYKDGYRNANFEYNSILFEKGYDNGNTLGMAKGSVNGKIDCLMGKPSDSGVDKLKEEDIIREYNLNNENKRYGDGFIGGFKKGFHLGYVEAYQLTSSTFFSEKLTEEIIPIGGGEIITEDGKLRLAIDNGVFYNDVFLSIDKNMQVDNSFDLPPEDRYIKNSELYLIKISNPYDKYNDENDIKISFEYYGGLKGGIYRYRYGKWRYIPSIITENSISGYIDPKSIQENAIYGVFIDEKAFNPLDIRGHWARDEIITTLRRGCTGLYPDKTFRPDSSITKVQLLLYLHRINNWNLDLDREDIELVEGLKDFSDIKTIKELVAYSIREGFLRVTKDNRFDPNTSISYEDMELIINKIYKDKNFTWNHVADKMARVKDKRSSSMNSMKHKVTRAEFSYMINLISE